MYRHYCSRGTHLSSIKGTFSIIVVRTSDVRKGRLAHSAFSFFDQHRDPANIVTLSIMHCSRTRRDNGNRVNVGSHKRPFIRSVRIYNAVQSRCDRKRISRDTTRIIISIALEKFKKQLRFVRCAHIDAMSR